MADEPFTGHHSRECGEHRTTGMRAWCFDDTEWCSAAIPCRGCELPTLRAERDALKAAIDAATEVDHAHIKEFHPTRIRVTDCAGCRIGLMLSKLTPASAPESPATAPTAPQE